LCRGSTCRPGTWRLYIHADDAEHNGANEGKAVREEEESDGSGGGQDEGIGEEEERVDSSVKRASGLGRDTLGFRPWARRFIYHTV
jgi:hypothetical protein